jgi:hypothetical protein
MKRIIAIIAAAVCLHAALPAGAQERAEAGEKQISDVTEYKFDDVTVTGDIIGPDGTIVIASLKGKSRSLIKVRSNFVRSMLQSVEDI